MWCHHLSSLELQLVAGTVEIAKTNTFVYRRRIGLF